MPLKIDYINPQNLAAQAGMLEGDLIISINDHLIVDFLDLQYYAADEKLDILILRNETNFHLKILQDWETPLGIEPKPHKCRLCVNECIFCFVDQMRPDIRSSLYIKDDDYCLSFVFGNFITMTNLTQRDYDKIIEQHLSPFYVSVHATNPVLHKQMLRYKGDFNIIEKLRYLSEYDIEFHTQIVIVPGWNDGEELERSIRELSAPELNVLSIGIVPIGLTKYREGLEPLVNVDVAGARQILAIAKKYPKTLCSDEFYLLAGEVFPDTEHYGYFDQLENGVGMVRMFLDNWQDNRSEFIELLNDYQERFVLVSGTLSKDLISDISNQINLELPDKTRTLAIDNRFLGPTVTVTGLIAAKDIIEQLDLAENEIVILSKGMFNDDQISIDNMTINDLREQLGTKLLIVDEEFSEWFWVE